MNQKGKGNDNFQTYTSKLFTATNNSNILMFKNQQTTGDTALLLDNVKIVPVAMCKYFGDNFDVKANAYAKVYNPDNDNPGRFDGLIGDVHYRQGGTTANFFAQISHHSRPGTLMLATRNVAGQKLVFISPDHNFVDNFFPSEEGTVYNLSFRTAPAYAFDNGDLITGSTNWSAVVFGSLETDYTRNVSQSNGVGILFRNNGGVQVFDKNNAILNFGAGTFTMDEDGWADVFIQYMVKDFDGTTSVDVSLYINDVLLTSFTTDTGFSANYLSFLSFAPNSNTMYAYSYFDNIALYSTAIPEPATWIPEPATWITLLLGLFGLYFIRKKSFPITK